MEKLLLQSVQNLVRQCGLPRLIPEIEKHIKESLVIQTAQTDEEFIPLGKSKIGGFPDLPGFIEWPMWNGKPLAFIAQINLADLPSYDYLNNLPRNGILSFFYSAEQETWGFDPKDKESWRVFYFDEIELNRRDISIDWLRDGKYKSCSVKFKYSITIPSLVSPFINWNYDNPDWDEATRYEDLEKQLSQILDEGMCIHRMFGHPDEIQDGDMRRQCQLVTNGIYMGNLIDKENTHIKKLEAGALDWELLLQIDSDDNANMMWGDVGRLYFWIPTKELAKKNFDATWMILQCC